MICSASYANNSESTKESKITKIYIDPNNIQFDEKHIYVCIDQEWIQVSAIFTDKLGFFIVNEQQAWTCPRCNFYNTKLTYKCGNPNGCNYSRI